MHNQINEHIIRLHKTFWRENSQKQAEIGEMCFKKALANVKDKINIYETFFGKAQSRISGIRQTKFDTTTEQPVKLSKSLEDDDLLKKYTVRVGVEMAQIKQSEILSDELFS